jgi:hypothetical protein
MKKYGVRMFINVQNYDFVRCPTRVHTLKLIFRYNFISYPTRLCILRHVLYDYSEWYGEEAMGGRKHICDYIFLQDLS